MTFLTPRIRKQILRGGVIVASVAAFVLLWHVGSLAFPRQLPAPYEVTVRAVELVSEPGPRGYTGLDHLGVSLRRVFIVLGVSMLLSVVIGVLMGISSTAESVIGTWLPFAMTSPDVVVILIVMIILGFDGQSIIAAVIFTATPFGVVNMWGGMRDIDADLIEMARAFDSSSALIWRYIYLPHLLSYLFASARYMLGMIWKIVLVGEAFGTSSGMGAIIRFWFNQGEITPILSYLAMFIVVMFVIEYGVLKPLEFRLFAWRDE